MYLAHGIVRMGSSSPFRTVEPAAMRTEASQRAASCCSKGDCTYFATALKRPSPLEKHTDYRIIVHSVSLPPVEPPVATPLLIRFSRLGQHANTREHVTHYSSSLSLFTICFFFLKTQPSTSKLHRWNPNSESLPRSDLESRDS
jgi:hypothetical protein